MILNNGAKPVLAFKNMDPGPGMRDAIGLVLATRSSNRTAWVVWDIAKNDDEEGWDCQNGDYFDSRHEAEHMFGLRLMRYHLNDRCIRGVAAV